MDFELFLDGPIVNPVSDQLLLKEMVVPDLSRVWAGHLIHILAATAAAATRAAVGGFGIGLMTSSPPKKIVKIR